MIMYAIERSIMDSTNITIVAVIVGLIVIVFEYRHLSARRKQ
jgi:hypothetical protein